MISMETKTFEEKFLAIRAKAEEMRVLINAQPGCSDHPLGEEHTEVRLSYLSDGQWILDISPSLMAFGDKFTHLMTRGYHSMDLAELLDEALKGQTEEVELLKNGKTLRIG